jgi:methylated-DNA-[protein]-cysteine S-methyltransferase
MIDMKQFSKMVYQLTKHIPEGKVATYKSIAATLNTKGYRAVGQVLKMNRNPDVPCHRVVRSNGEIGGFLGTKSIPKKIKN